MSCFTLIRTVKACKLLTQISRLDGVTLLSSSTLLHMATPSAKVKFYLTRVNNSFFESITNVQQT